VENRLKYVRTNYARYYFRWRKRDETARTVFTLLILRPDKRPSVFSAGHFFQGLFSTIFGTRAPVAHRNDDRCFFFRYLPKMAVPYPTATGTRVALIGRQYVRIKGPRRSFKALRNNRTPRDFPALRRLLFSRYTCFPLFGSRHALVY